MPEPSRHCAEQSLPLSASRTFELNPVDFTQVCDTTTADAFAPPGRGIHPPAVSLFTQAARNNRPHLIEPFE